ncbi:MAG: hypothetical protein ACI9EW_001722 [Cellvibrionaceae bacterium]|jgi:hypothetical protein
MDSTLLRRKLHQKIDELPEQVLEEVYSLASQYIEPTWREVVDQHLAEETDPKELAMWREESAYLDQHEELKANYLGEYIAMKDGQFIDHDSNLTTLHKRVKKVSPNQFVLVTLVEQEPATIYRIRSPRLA